MLWCLEAPYGVGLKRGGSGSGVYVRFRGKDGVGGGMALPQLQQRAIHPQRLRGPRTANGACDGAPSNRFHEPHLRKAINAVKNDLLLGEDVEQQAQRGSSKITLLASPRKEKVQVSSVLSNFSLTKPPQGIPSSPLDPRTKELVVAILSSCLARILSTARLRLPRYLNGVDCHR